MEEANFEGIQKWAGHPDLLVYTDRETGSTFMVYSKAEIPEELERIRKSFGK